MSSSPAAAATHERSAAAGQEVPSNPGAAAPPLESAAGAARGPAVGEPFRRIGVVGAGTMGNGIAHVFAQSGREVRLVDTDPAALERALSAIRSNLERQARKGSLTEPPADVLAHITCHPDLESLAGSDLVVEAIVEDSDAKLGLFEELGRTASGAILASNTSAISITLLASRVPRPERVIGMHFMNPVPVMPLVEIVVAVDTSESTREAVVSLCRSLGKTPVVVNDAPGFVSNRVLMPMINEAVFCLAEGVAEPVAIDQVMKLGMRHPMGPLELADLIGLDVCLAILEVLHAQLGEDKYRPCPLLRRMVAAGHLGRKSGRGFYPYRGSDG